LLARPGLREVHPLTPNKASKKYGACTMSEENIVPIINQQDTDDMIDNRIVVDEESKNTVTSTAVAPAAGAVKHAFENADLDHTLMNTDVNTKRPRVAGDDIEAANTAPARSTENEETDEYLDLAHTIGLKSGDRIEVLWEVDSTNDDDDDGVADVNVTTSTSTETTTAHVHWWGATLLEHDGRTEDNVAIRTLLYDPYPDGGFTETSSEDVVFMGHNMLLSYPSQDELQYRVLTDDGSEVAYVLSNDQDIEDLVDTILSNALQNTKTNFQALPRSKQMIMAEKIATKKEKLIQLMKEHMHEQRATGDKNTINRPVTANDALQLLARAMAE
jgi:hypothetical protein